MIAAGLIPPEWVRRVHAPDHHGSDRPPGQPPTASADPDSAIDIDLYCLHCGYNLRGLSGDPVRCPECGGHSERGILHIPAAMITLALRQMESGPSAMVFAAFATIFMTILGVAARLPVPLVLAAIAAAGWLVGYMRALRHGGSRSGWVRLILEFHLIMLLWTSLLPLLLLFVWLERHFDIPDGGAAAAMFLALGMIVWGFYRYRAARRRLAELKRDEAVRIARKLLGRALGRRR